MAPEQARPPGSHNMALAQTEQADVYALGTLLLAMLLGEEPFAAESQAFIEEQVQVCVGVCVCMRSDSQENWFLMPKSSKISGCKSSPTACRDTSALTA